MVFPDRERLFRLYREVGVARDDEAYRRAERTAREALVRKVGPGATGTEVAVWRDFFLTLFRDSGVPPEATDDLAERVREEHRRFHLWTEPAEGAAEALAELRSRGFRVGVVSNADGRVERVLERTGLRPFLEFVVDSHVVGFEKPSPRIFLEGVRRLGLSPAQCVYVGDLFPVDVLGAWRAGMHALLVDPWGGAPPDVSTIPDIRDLSRRLSPGEGLPSRGRSVTG